MSDQLQVVLVAAGYAALVGMAGLGLGYLLRRSSFRELLGADWAHGVEPAIDIALLGRYYERIADHAVSIARRVVFLVTGETIPMLDA